MSMGRCLPSSAKYGGMEKGISFSTVSASWVICWKPPAEPLIVPSIPYVFRNSASYFVAPPPTSAVMAISYHSK